jgi:hypothetical protein
LIRRKTTIIFYFAAALAFFAILSFQRSASAAGGLKFGASVNTNRLGVNEYLQYTLSVSGINGRIERPKPPDFKGFDIVDQSTAQSAYFNGRDMTSSIQFTYILAPRRVGKFTIPPATFNYDGNSYKTDPIAVEVLKGESKPQQQAPVNMAPSLAPQPQDRGVTDNFFFKTSVDKASAVVNEPITLTVGFYYRVRFYNAKMDELPSFSGFWKEELPESKDARESVIEGRRYLVQEWKYVLFPTASGSFTIGEAKLLLQTSPFESAYQLKTKPIKITVKDLPEEGRPADFNGAVGIYSMKADLSSATDKTNEAVTLKVTVSGSGNARSIGDLNVSLPTDIEIYESKNNNDVFKNETGVTGQKIYEYALIPRAPGNYTIEPVSFSYYDYSAKKYKTLTSRPFNLKVAGLASRAVPATASPIARRDTAAVIKKDINYIKPSNDDDAWIALIYRNPIYWALHLCIPGALIATALRKRRRDLFRSDTALARSSLAKSVASRRLRRARALLEKGNPEEFYAELSRVVCAFCADKLNVSARGLVMDNLIGMMSDGISEGFPEESLRKCLSNCDTARFSPVKPSSEEMLTSYEDARQLIDTMERNWKRRG